MPRLPITSAQEEQEEYTSPMELTGEHGNESALAVGSTDEATQGAKRIMMEDIRDEDRPRERLKRLGAKSLGQEELLAIILRVGMRNKSVLDLASEVLEAYDNDLLQLADQSVTTLQRYKGMGETKAITVLAAIELGRRCVDVRAASVDKISQPKDIYNAVAQKYVGCDQEEVWVLYMDNQNRLLDMVMHSRGTGTNSAIDTRIITRAALVKKAYAVALTHNHPSGDPKPSRADVNVTLELRDALKMFNIRLLDHIVVGSAARGYVSMVEEGLI